MNLVKALLMQGNNGLGPASWPTMPVRKANIARVIGLPRSLALANRLSVIQGAAEDQYGDMARRQMIFGSFQAPMQGPRTAKSALMSKRFGQGVDGGLARVMRIFGNAPGR